MANSELNLTLTRLQTPQNDDVVHVTFNRTGARPRAELFLKPSIAASPSRLYTQLLDKGAALPPRKEALPLLETAIRSIPPDAGYLLDGPGWHGEIPHMSFVLPDAVIGTAPGIVMMSDRAKADCVAKGLAGTLDAWKAEVASPLSRSGVAGLALLTVLAAPLLKFARLSENFVVNVFGNSSAGKTSGNLAASSVFGDPSAIPSWNASPTGLAQWTAANTDLPLIPDDAETAAEEPSERLPKLHALTHHLTGRSSKKYARGVSGPDQLQVANFRSLVLSSSPASIEQANTRTDGDRVRWFDIPVPHGNVGGIWAPYNGGDQPADTAALSNGLVEAAKRNHGEAGRAYLRYLVDNQGTLTNDIERYTKNFLNASAKTANSVEGRIARKFALLFAAGRLARKAGILPWTKEDVLGIATFGYKSALATAFGEAFDQQRALARLRAKLQDKALFPRIEGSLAQARVTPDALGYAWQQGDRIFMLLEAFHLIVSEAGAGSPSPSEKTALLDYLRGEGALLNGHGDNATRDVRIGSIKRKFLAFRLTRLGELLPKK